jgi:hypothetical protein
VDKKNPKDWKGTKEFGFKKHLLGEMVSIGMKNGG